MNEEKIQKLNYINENIIEKGYNPEELSNFIIKKTGIPMEHIKFEQLKQMIEEFKDQGLQDTYQTVKIKDSTKKKEESFQDILYSDQKYDIKTQSTQKNKLLELEEKKEIIKVTISEPKLQKSGGFFSKAKYSYKVTCKNLEKEVQRTYNDFEWLRDQLSNRYSLRVVPPIIKENAINQFDLIEKTDTDEMIELKKIKCLNIFMNKLLKKRLFRTSPLLYEFLILDEVKFKQYKELIAKNKYELNISLDNLKAYKGNIQCEMKKDDIKKADVFNTKYLKLSEIYQKLDKSLSNIISDFQLLENHMKDASNQFMLLSTEFSDIQNGDKLKNYFSQLNKLFVQWSVSYGNQYKFFKEEFRTLFKYNNLETQELSFIYKNYINFKNEYEDFTIRINKKKEELFEQKDYSKWSLAPGTESQLPMFQNNKKMAFEKMLYKETFLLTVEKKRIACTVHLLFKEFHKMLKHQSNDLEEFLISLKDKNEYVVGDANNLIKLFELLTIEKEKDKEKEKEKEKEKKEGENKNKNKIYIV